MKKKRYVQIGVGARARFFYLGLLNDFLEYSELTAFCDTSRTRLEFAVKQVREETSYKGDIALYDASEFEKMIEEQKPDCVIVTTIDRTHHKYIIKALEMGCDVISEKPMTIDNEKCQEILDAVKRTGRKLRVSFNYRYAPKNTQIRELIASGVIGDVKAVHFDWSLSTTHGADYFRRWHRDKRNSGGLLVHKSTHHFDLVNFWLNTQPKQVFAYGDLAFYGRENAENRGVTNFYDRTHGFPKALEDPFGKDCDFATNEYLKNLYHDAEQDDAYIRDRSVFSDGISIEDTMGVIVKYKSGAIMTYSLTAYAPYEGYRVVFTGTKGKIEYNVTENAYFNGGGDRHLEGASLGSSIIVFPMFGEPYNVEVKEGKGGHGGGDPILLNDLFGVPVEDPFNRAASHVDGAMSILTGVAANKSMASGMPINIDSLVQF